MTLDHLLLFLEWCSRCEWRNMNYPTWAGVFFFFFFVIAQSLIMITFLIAGNLTEQLTKLITIFRYVKRSAIFLSNTCGAIVKKKRKEKKLSMARTIDDDRYRLLSAGKSGNGLFVFQLSLTVTYSGQFTWQGHRKLQWAIFMMSKDEPLLSNKMCQLETADPSRNYARVPGYKKEGQEKDKKLSRSPFFALRFCVFVAPGLEWSRISSFSQPWPWQKEACVDIFDTDLTNTSLLAIFFLHTDMHSPVHRRTCFQHICTRSRGAVVSAALSERKVAGSIPTIGDFHTVGPCKKAVFACLATDVK